VTPEVAKALYEVAEQLHWVCEAIMKAGGSIAGAIIIASIVRAMCNK